MKKLINTLVVILALVFGGVSAATAQYRDFRPDYDYYGDDFDWRWDVRVRITDGINSGRLTNWEANRMYRKLERIEEKEYLYAADGVYDAWEQNDVWDDVQWLHTQLGMELRDADRVFYGFTRPGIAFYGYPSWWYGGGYNFYRYDRLGYGSVNYGYVRRCYVPTWVPDRHVYVQRYQNHSHGNHRPNDNRSSAYESRGPRTSGRNDTYNHNDSYSRGNTRTYENNRNYDSGRRSSSIENQGNIDRSGSVSRETRPATRSNGGTASVPSRPMTPRNESARPAMPQHRSESPASRTYSGSGESLNKSRGSSTYSRGRVESNSPTQSRTKLPEAGRSSTATRGARQQ